MRDLAIHAAPSTKSTETDAFLGHSERVSTGKQYKAHSKLEKAAERCYHVKVFEGL